MAPTSPRWTPKREAALFWVAQDRVSWHHAGRGISYKVWGSADDNQRAYVTETLTVSWLIGCRLARKEQGWRFGSGPVVLRPEGWEAVADFLAGFWEGLTIARW